MVRQWLARQGGGVAVGLGLTAAAIVLHASGVTERIELLGFDYHVRHFSRIPGSDTIVHIDIDDDALDRVGSWPWPRDVQAELIGILGELGAERIVMDIVWSEPRSAEVRLPTLDPYAEIEGELDLAGEFSQENVVRPDDELAGAIAAAGNVYLAMYYGAGEDGRQLSPLADRIAGLLREDKGFGLSSEEIARELGASREAVEAVLAGVKRSVARERVQSLLDADSTLSVQEVHARILDGPFDRQTADRTDILAAYHRVLCLRALEVEEMCPLVPETLRGKLPVVSSVVPPVHKFTSGAGGVGFVTFSPDRDGRTRHVPLVMEWNGRLIEQLAFAAAREALDIRLEDLAIDEGGDLRIAARDRRPAMRVQLDDNGQMLINWHTPSDRWTDCFTHLPAAQLLRIHHCRRQIAGNKIRRQLKIGEALGLTMVKGEQGYADYCRHYRDMLRNERIARLGGLRGKVKSADVVSAEAEARRLRDWVKAEQEQQLALIDENWSDLKGQDPNDPGIVDIYRRYEKATRLLGKDLEVLEQVNAGIEVEEKRLARQLQPMIAGKTCFIGYTATAVADMVTTPAYERMPGVLVHSNTFNNFLQGQFRSWSPRWVQVGVIGLLGVLMTVLTTIRGPRFSLLLLVLVLIAAAAGLNALGLFERMDHWLRLLTAMVLMFVVWAMIVLVRYLTTDRQRRHLRKAVAQYVSPAMARRIADSAERLDLSPVSGEVTCFFSDLQGFTPISERLGPEGTRTVLNPYLEAMSDVLHRHQALINKFMGDGVFAFFNPPILPCANHEVAACESALDCQRALEEMGDRYADHELAGEFRRLSMRIGVASGSVFVGDYGSENKLDYTCMGDTVNLASRLESANKQFGSTIMLAGNTQEKVGDRYVYRRLGVLQVKGQTKGTLVYELLGRSGEVGDEVLRLAEVFDQAVEAYARRDWSRSAATFERCLELRPGDPGAVRYLATSRLYQVNPPPADWNGALELTEK